jgi:hypothetical protein
MYSYIDRCITVASEINSVMDYQDEEYPPSSGNMPVMACSTGDGSAVTLEGHIIAATGAMCTGSQPPDYAQPDICDPGVWCCDPIILASHCKN